MVDVAQAESPQLTFLPSDATIAKSPIQELVRQIKTISQLVTNIGVAATLTVLGVATATAGDDLPPRAGNYPGTVEKLDWPKGPITTKPTHKKPADKADTDNQPSDNRPKIR